MPRQAGRWSPTALRILGAAAELIALRGYSSTSTRDIAAAVGVEQPAIYKHFSAKRDILAALVRLAVEWPLELFGHITAMPVPAVVKLHRWLTESLDHLHASPYVLVSILITPDLHQESFVAERELVAEMERALVGLIETGQGEGDVRAMHPLSAARLVQALFDALALPEFAVSPDEIVEFAMTALLSDPDRLAEIRAAADALEIQTAPRPRALGVRKRGGRGWRASDGNQNFHEIAVIRRAVFLQFVLRVQRRAPLPESLAGTSCRGRGWADELFGVAAGD